MSVPATWRIAIHFDPRLLQRVTVIWLGALLAAVTLNPRRSVLSTWGLAESVCWLVYLVLLASLTEVQAFLGSMPRAYKRFIGFALAALLFGQFMSRPDLTFPLGCWRMFSGPRLTFDRPSAVFELEGVTADGRKVNLNPSRLVPSLKHHRMVMGLKTLIRFVDARGEEGAKIPAQVLSELLIGIGRLHNQLHPNSAIESVTVMRRRLLPRRTPSESIEREPMMKVALDAPIQ